MYDFIDIKIRKSKNGTTITPIFDSTIESKDILVRAHNLYGLWNYNENKWETVPEKASSLVDEELRKFAETYKADHPDEIVEIELIKDDTTRTPERFSKYFMRRSDTLIAFNSKMIFRNEEIKREDYCTKKAAYALNDGSREHYEKLISTLYSPEERHKIEWLIGAIISGHNADVQKFGVFYGPPGSGKSTVINIIEMLFDGYKSTFSSRALADGDQFETSAFKSNPLVSVDGDGDLSRLGTNTIINKITGHDVIRVNEKHMPRFDLRPLAILFICTNSPVKITDSKSGLLRRLIDINPTGNILPISEYNEAMCMIAFELGAIAYHCKQVYLSDPGYYNSYRPTEMMEETNDFYDFMLTYYQAFLNDGVTTLSVAWERYKEYIEDGGYSFKLNKRIFKHELKSYFKEFELQGSVIGSDGKAKHASNIYKEFRVELFRKSIDTIMKANAEPKDSEVKANGYIYEGIPDWLKLTSADESKKTPLDVLLEDAHAQYATSSENEAPRRSWKDKNGIWNVATRLKDILPNQVHYVLSQEVEPSLIVIDLDKKGDGGGKSLRENLLAAKGFPKTYAEVSKGGQGLHLHYIYDGDPDELSRVYDDNIEIKVFKGLSALRRRLSLCNNEPIAHLNSGLPLRGDRGRKAAMIDWSTVKDEKALRTLIRRNLAKEYHADTTSSIHFIKKILDDAYESGATYDVRDLRGAVMNFAQAATNQSQHCMECVMEMEFKSKDILDSNMADSCEAQYDEPDSKNIEEENKKPIVFYDIEVFPNLFVVCYKKQGPGGKEACVKLINPTANDLIRLVESSRLIGFNNLEYDNILIYARILGYSIRQLYELSKKIINKEGEVGFHESKKISYTDVHDFANTKQKLKKWEIELHEHHQELGLDWNKEVPEELWDLVADYCCNDVVATEKVFDHLQADWIARQTLAKLSGLTVNDKTNAHTIRILFGKNKKPQNEFIYTDLSTIFPGYEFCETGIDKSRYIKDEKGKPIYVKGKSIYMGEDPSEGGYVYAKPGMYENVALLDIASLHPSSLEQLQAFGPRYTKRFSEIKQTRVYLKHKEWDKAREALGGVMVPFLEGVENLSAEKQQEISDALAYAYKIVINSTYGLTSANFPNACKDPRNVDNIVAKRGALFMITLKNEVLKRGYVVAHVKTDSIKIPNADKEIIDFVMEFGKKYGYSFEHEATYKKMCLVNDAVYIAQYDEQGERTKGGRHANCWTATGAQFAVPYIFKTLFSHEEIEFDDLCETKSVASGASIFLDMDEDMEAERIPIEKALSKFKDKHAVSVKAENGVNRRVIKEELLSPEELEEYKGYLEKIVKLHDYHFVGAVGQFCPINKGLGAGTLVRGKDEVYSSLSGTKGYRWLESEQVRTLGKEKDIDKSYFRELVDKAYAEISKYGDAEEFING